MNNINLLDNFKTFLNFGIGITTKLLRQIMVKLALGHDVEIDVLEGNRKTSRRLSNSRHPFTNSGKAFAIKSGLHSGYVGGCVGRDEGIEAGRGLM